MTWREAISQVRPLDGYLIAAEVARRWKGARLYLPIRAARLHWRGEQPQGAAERFAASMRDIVVLRGGTTSQARAILLSLAGRHFVV